MQKEEQLNLKTVVGQGTFLSNLYDSFHVYLIWYVSLFTEASYAVHARAITDHHNLYDPNSLSFKEGDYIKVGF